MDGNTNIRKFTSNDIFLYQARNEINGQGPHYPIANSNGTYGYGITPHLENKFFTSCDFTRSDVASNYINGGREDGWLGPTKSLCDSTG